MKLTQTKDGAVIEIYVKPNSPKFGVSVEDGEIVVHCTQEPKKGKVNKEILKEFSKLFHCRVEITSGATSRNKRLLIKGIKKEEVKNLL